MFRSGAIHAIVGDMVRLACAARVPSPDARRPREKYLWCHAVLAAALLECVAALAVAQDVAVVAVLGLSGTGLSEGELALFEDYVTSYIVDTGKYRVVSVQERSRLLAEQAFSLSECSDRECQIRVGELLAADLVVVGSVGQFGGRYVLSLKVLDVQSGETLKSYSDTFETVDSLFLGAEYLAHAIVGEEERYEAARLSREEADRRAEAERRHVEEQRARQAAAEVRRRQAAATWAAILERIRCLWLGVGAGRAVCVDLGFFYGASFATTAEMLGANMAAGLWFTRVEPSSSRLGFGVGLGPVVGFAVESGYSDQARAALLIAARGYVGNVSRFAVALDVGYLGGREVVRGFYYAVGAALGPLLFQMGVNSGGVYGTLGFTLFPFNPRIQDE